jgi:hypothetical protein
MNTKDIFTNHSIVTKEFSDTSIYILKVIGFVVFILASLSVFLYIAVIAWIISLGHLNLISYICKNVENIMEKDGKFLKIRANDIFINHSFIEPAFVNFFNKCWHGIITLSVCALLLFVVLLWAITLGHIVIWKSKWCTNLVDKYFHDPVR